jgi:protein-disulfide isomerase
MIHARRRVLLAGFALLPWIAALGVAAPGPAGSSASSPALSPASDDEAREQDCEDPIEEGVIAILNGERIGADRIEAAAAQGLDRVERRRLELRFQLISRAIQDRLLDGEAAVRGVTVEDLLSTQVHARVEEPTPLEVESYGKRHPDRYGADLDHARPWIVADLRAERIAARGEQYLNSLVDAAEVEWRFDFRDPSAEPGRGEVLAVVDGAPIFADGLREQWEDQEHEADLAAYHERKFQLDLLINSRLLEAAAAAAEVDTRAYLESWLDTRTREVTAADVEEFYGANATRIVEPFEAVRESIRAHLEQQRRFDLELLFARELREAADLVIHLPVPQPPVHLLDVEGRPFLGAEEAPILIVAFTDLQCGRCRELHGWLARMPEFHEGRVRVVFCHKPLLTLHPQAHELAVAAEAAREQGAYHAFIERAFEEQSTWSTLDPSTADATAPILKWADDLGLDLERFEGALADPGPRGQVEADIAEATRLGILRTPVIFVNGRRVPDSSVESIFRSVRLEFDRLGLEVDPDLEVKRSDD